MSSAILFNFICKQSKNALVALAVLAVSGVDPLFAANFTVTNTNDSGAGSLRQAILDANDNTPPSADTIDLTGVAGTITLTSGELAITDALTITGPGANVLTISGNDASRVFSINTPGLAVKISDLQITNGYEDSDNGGGMLITAGTVTLDRLVIGGPTTGETNFAAAGGAIWNMGTLTINHSSIMTNVGSFDAGGIMNTGSVTIANSTISGNNAGPGIGGGIWTTGTVRLTNSTIADNEATDGGGIYVDNASTADISNSTIAGNLRGPSGEGGAIYAASTATVNLKNTIVANSKHKDTLVVVDNCFQAAAGIVSFGYNLSDDASCTSLIATGDMQSANAGLDPLGLQDNGGTTLTIALQVSSDARGAIPTFALCRDKFFQNIETDQRGIPRPQGLNCDIGAYELDGGGGAILLVTSTTDEDPGSLRNVIAAAEPDDIVQFHDSLFAGGNVTLTFPRTTDGKCGPLKDARATALVIDKSLTIAGPGRDFLTLSGTGASDDCRVVWVEPNISTLFSGLTIAAGQITQQFGANFYNKGSTTLSDCAVTGGTIVNFGGGAGIYNAASGLPLAVNNCVIANNEITGTSSFHGAGIAHQGTGLLTLTDTTVTGNTGGNYGAAIASESNGDLTILSSTISNNVGRYHGGVYTFGAGKLTLTNSTLSGNTVTDKVGSQSWGGGLYIAGSDLALITNSTIAANDGYNFIAGTANIFFKNTILADSEIDNCRDENASSFFNVRTSGHNLADDASCGFFIKAPVGTDRPSTDPLLGPLQDNGGLGPTETHALLAGSVALDDIPLANCTLVTNSQTQNTPVSKDQRGISRPQGLNCDIGAYELESAQALLDPTTTWNVTPQVQSFPAGRVCPAGTLLSDKFQNVTAGGESGSTFATFPVDGVDVTITISWGNDNTIDFDVENGVLPRVFVKGGGESYLLYQYDPPVAAATNSGPVSSDTDLHDGFNNDQGTFQDVSHLDFCVLTIAAPLRAEKTANASYDERHDWDVLKTVDPTSQSEFAGNAVSWTWTIDIFEQVVNQNFAVTGNIAVYNDNDFDVPVSIADVLDDGTVATITCPVTNDNTGTVPANGSLICPYSASPADASATLNTATITSGNPDVEGDSATAPVNFIANVVNDEATVTDTVIGLIGESVSGGNQFTADEGDVCSSDQAVYGEDGKYEVSLINTAILTDEEGTEYESTANGSYTCYAPLVTKDASASYDERWTWTLTKTVDPESQSQFAGSALNDWTWTVIVDESAVDENYSVTGTIYVANPSGSPGSMTVAIADVLDDATIATVDCGSGATSLEVAPGATGTCSYSASPADASATLNTATGTFNGIDFVGTANFNFQKNVVNDTATVTDDQIELDESLTADDGGMRQWMSTEGATCSSNPGDYTDGKYSVTEDNTATLTSDDQNLSEDASTTYDCYAPVISKDADASYDERHTWDIEKVVDPTSQSGYPGDELSWEWKVTLSESSVDENISVIGDISVTNPVGSPGNMTVAVTDALNDGTLATVDCGSGATSVVVAPGATETCSYSASPTDTSATLNTATGAFNGINFAGSAAVSFVANVINGTADVDDDQEPDLPETVVAGDGPWEWTETQSHTCSLEIADYAADGTYSDTRYNTATVNASDGQNDSSSADTTYTCEAGTIDVLKHTYGGADDTYDWRFALYVGPDGFDGTQVGNFSSTLNDADGVLDFGDPVPALRPDTTYTVCELGVAAGWATNWSIGGTTVIPYNPNADDPLPEDLGNRCFDVGAGTSYPVTVGRNLRIAVNNTFPGGDARTPGYWKNWSSCSGGGQYAKTTNDVDPANEFVSLDEVLNDPGISWCDFTIDSCELAVSILDQRDFESGKKMSSDAAYTLAMHLLAADLNYGAGAERCDLADDAIVAARILICDLGFDATGAYLRPKGQTNTDYYYALDLKDLLDDYNNGRLCGEEVAFDFPPNISIDEPAEGDVIGDGGANEVTTVTIEASTSDDYGVTQVEFFVGGVSIGVDSDDSDGWSANWDVNGLADATYSLVATATDTIGQTASHSIEVTLDNETGEPMHIGDLEPDNASGKGGKWDATVTITVHDEDHAPVEGALLSGAWTGGAANSCSTDGSGKCSITLSNINRNANAVSFTVDSVSAVGYDYLSGGNHDPDGESNGTTIAISKP